MPETTIDELAARIGALERQVMFLQAKPPRVPSQSTGIPESPADLAARVEELESQVARLRAARLPPRLPLPPPRGGVRWEQLMDARGVPPATPEEIEAFENALRDMGRTG